MPPKHHVIFVPGLDDQKRNYEFLVNRWAIYGIIPHVHRVNWHNNDSLEPKLKRLVKEADQYLQNSNIVSLVGWSAGGSAVLNALVMEPKINAAVNLCGRLRAGQNVHPSLEWAARNSKSFKESVLLFESREPKMPQELREKVLNLIPMWDEIVPKSTVYLRGARNQTIPTAEHMLSGFLGMTLFSPIMIGFLRQKAQKN